MRRFFITMNTKGRLNELRQRSELGNYISFEKTDKKQSEIVVIDTEGIIKSGNRLEPILIILGIHGTYASNPYKYRSELREIKENDNKEFCSVPVSDISKETEKAYYLEKLNNWIPKSLTVIKDDYLYIKRWFIAKML